MCIAPTVVEEVGPVACRCCWQCRHNRVNDLVGRCIAEQQTSDAVLAVTLTYAGDGVESAVLVYRDFQLLMKRLRFAGYKCRYLVVGEYGSKKGRAHWHAILFFRGKSPKVELGKRMWWKYWRAGFSFFQRPDYGGFAYLLKYVLKDETAQVSQYHLSMSKRPPLGYEWLMGLAERYVEQGLSPQRPLYGFRDQFDSKGKRRKFWLQGRSCELFCERYIELFQDRHGREYPFSEFLELQEDTWLRRENERRLWTEDEWAAHLAARPVVRRAAAAEVPEDVVSYLVGPGGELLVRLRSGVIELHVEGETWRVESERELRRALELADVGRRAAGLLSAAAFHRPAHRSGIASGGAPAPPGGRKRWPERSRLAEAPRRQF